MAKSSSRSFAILALGSLVFGGCTQLDNAIASVPYLAMMRNAPFFDPYEAPLPAPPGSIPYESPAGPHMPDMEATDAAITAFSTSAYAKNPFRNDDPAALAFGQKKFEQNCAVCHGMDAKGKGSIIGPDKFMMQPPDLTVTGRSEGYIYGIIRSGRGLMPSYGARVNHLERWAIATYVAHLQSQAGHAVNNAASAAPAAPAPGSASGAASTKPNAATTTTGQERQ